MNLILKKYIELKIILSKNELKIKSKNILITKSKEMTQQ